MKKLCIAFLMFALLAPCAGLASQERPAEESKGAMPLNSQQNQEIALGILEEALASNDPVKQAELIQRAVEAAPNDVSILHSCARLLFYMDDQDQYGDLCESYLRKALSLSEGDLKAAILQSLTEQLVYFGRDAEAFALIDEALAEAPKDENYRLVLATTQYYVGESDAAIATLEDLLEDSPENLVALRYRAIILTNEYLYDEALAAYRQINDQFPDYLDGLYGMYSVYSASGQFERAARMIDELLRNGGEYDLWLERAQLRLWKQYEPALALEEAIALLSADPDWIDAYVVKLGAYLQLQEYDNAMDTAGELEAFDTGYADLMRGIILMNQESWAEADAFFDMALKKSPGLYTVWQNKAAVQLDGFDDASAALKSLAKGFAATDMEGTPALFSQLGMVYKRQGSLLEAARAFAAANAFVHDEPSYLYYLVIVCLDAGREQDVIDMLSLMERQYPGFYETMLARFVVEDVFGRHEAALEAFLAYKDKFKNPASFHTYMEGILRIKAGEPEGIEFVEAWLENEQDPGESIIHAYALIQMGDWEAAEAALSKAEALIEEYGPERATEARLARIDVETTRAELLLLLGDAEGCMEALERAATLGFAVNQLKLYPQFSEICASDAFSALLSRYGTYDEPWDLSVLPKIPK